MENVKTFRSFQKGAVYRAVLNCFKEMGYSVQDAVFQAGNFGVPQSRSRVIIIAMRDGEVSPNLPRPTYCFPAVQRSTTYAPDAEIGAPYRMITVRDSISDLVKLPTNAKKTPAGKSADYKQKATTHYQRLMRQDSLALFDHEPRELNPLIQKRIELIPLGSGDWRDLPNIAIELSNGQRANKLVYTPGTKYVCSCKGRQGCKEKCQEKTLIPWCLPHTADRYNQWSGLYGRLNYDGYFATTVTMPEPMGKQGRVLHPTEHRIYTVREAARSQGFKDNARFCGSLTDKYRQIGNAVPPPLAFALGIELRYALAKSEKAKADKAQAEKTVKYPTKRT